MASTIASCVSELLHVTSKSSDEEKEKFLAWVKCPSRDLPLSRTDKCKISIMIALKDLIAYVIAAVEIPLCMHGNTAFTGNLSIILFYYSIKLLNTAIIDNGINIYITVYTIPLG